MGINFDNLLKPYREGGLRKTPVRRDLSTMASALIYKNQLPANIVGAAILITFKEMAENGLEFKGTGKYGSKGRELFLHIKQEAIKLAKERAVNDVVSHILQENVCLKFSCPLRTQKIKKLTRWNRFVRFWLKPRVLWRV